MLQRVTLHDLWSGDEWRRESIHNRGKELWTILASLPALVAVDISLSKGTRLHNPHPYGNEVSSLKQIRYDLGLWMH